MTVQKFIQRVLALVFLVCMPVTLLWASDESYIQTLTGKIKKGDSCIVIDDKYLNLPLNDWNQIQHLSVNNIVAFELRFDTSVYFYNKAFTCTLNVSIKYYTSRDQQTPEEINNVDLVVKYDTAQGAWYPANAQYKFKNAFKVIVVVNSITSQEWGTEIPAIFRLRNQILVQRKYPFDAGGGGPLQVSQVSAQNKPSGGMTLFAATQVTGETNSKQLVISWNSSDFPNSEEYDVEWAFVDRLSKNGDNIHNLYGDGATLPTAMAGEWMRFDNSRITVPVTTYTINLPYPNGYMLVRVRGAAYDATTGVRKTTAWAYDNGSSYAVCEPVEAHEENINWQYSTAFAEEGKRKEAITYFDGTLRNRQSVTLNNSDKTLVPGEEPDRQETAIVQETIYDKMGRATASILPAPHPGKSLNFYYGFNVNNAGEHFGHFDINFGTDCHIVANYLNNTSGASKYYSAANPFLNDNNFDFFTKYVPDAENYPYALTEYMPDNTGRIRQQGGVGKAFQIGQVTDGKTHTTQYFYGKPGQKELDRIFGIEAGNKSHYLKNMVIDPNGQASISYIDANGKTIATALTGGAPAQLDALPSAAESEARIHMNQDLIGASDFRRDPGEMLMQSSATFLAAVQGPFEVHYSVNPSAVKTIHGQGEFCSNCYYDVLVEVKDACGSVLNSAPSTPFTGNDITCHPNAVPVTGSLSVQVPGPGEYTVTYTLRLSPDVVKYQVDYYIQNNSDLKKLQFFFEQELAKLDLTGCYSSCEGCKTLGTQTEFRTRVLERLNSEKFSGVTATTYVQTWVNDTWTTLKNKCNTISCEATSACESYLAQMKEDVKPGGQYALYTVDAQDVYSFSEPTINAMRFYNLNDPNNSEIYNFSYVNESGSTVLIRNLSASDFVKVYMLHPEWADMFVKKHVEYCGYLFCKDQSFIPADKNNEASYNFDKTLREMVATGAEAETRGYYNRSNMNALPDADPFFNGGRGTIWKVQMEQDLANLSNVIGFQVKNSSGTTLAGKNIFQFIDWMLYCKPGEGATESQLVTSWSSCSPGSSCRSKTMEWELYRNYYLQLKSKYVRNVKLQVDVNCTSCFIGSDPTASCTTSTPPSNPPCPDNEEFSIIQKNPRNFYDSEGNLISTLTDAYVKHISGAVTSTVTVKVISITPTEDGQQVSEKYVDIPAGQSEAFIGFTRTCPGSNLGCTPVHWEFSDVVCPPAVIPSTCISDPRHASYENKIRVFNDYIDDRGFVDCIADNPQAKPTPAQIAAQYRVNAIEDLENLKIMWRDQLRAVRTEESAFSSITDGTIDALVDALYDVAEANIQQQTDPKLIRPASNYPGTQPAGVYVDFAATFTAKIGASLVQQGFSQDLLERPYPYDKTPIDVNPNGSLITASICSSLSELKLRYANSGNTNGLFAYMKQELGDDMVLTEMQLADLDSRCTNNCSYLDELTLLPAALATPATGDYPFVNCSRISSLRTTFLSKYPSIDQDSKLYRVLYANFINHNLGYALSYGEYDAFTDKCGVNNLAVLYNKPASPAVRTDDLACVANNLSSAYERGGQEYDYYITQERARFRNLYISKCLDNTATASVEGDQYEYHYTLYYYNQSGNLVKTIPPEGVRFLTEDEIADVQEQRESAPVSACDGAGIPTSEDKTATFNAFSSGLQSSTVQSLEMWLNDESSTRQVRIITPDNKYMYQAAIADNKLWVELYTLTPGSNGDIEINLTNQVSADIGSITLQPWTHLVVQSANFKETPWEIYLDGQQLTLLPSINEPPYPFSWEISAGFTLPAEEIAQLKHFRLYNQFANSSQVQANYANACLAPVGALAVPDTRLLVWGRFNIPSLCDPARETVEKPNRGALQLNVSLNNSGNEFNDISNSFTVEFWANPQEIHQIDLQSQTGTAGTSGQKFAIYPDWGGFASTNRAGMGVSVGTNGVSVYEHADAYMPALLVWEGSITAWTHIAVVYNNRTPSLYINGQLAKTGLTSTKQTINPSYNIGSYTLPVMVGGIDEVRIWSVARTQQQIAENYSKGISPTEANLAGYWPISPEDKTRLTDISCNHNHLPLPASGYTWLTTGASINNITNVEIAEPPIIVPKHGLPTNYAYNSLNQVIKQSSPDGGTTQFWYDRLGKLVASQNAEQLESSTGDENNRYSYTKYDAFDRIVEVGEKKNVSIGSINEETARNNNSLQMWMTSGGNYQMTQTIYDEAPNFAPGLLSNLRKRVAASIVLEYDIFGLQRIAASYFSYDIAGNVKTLYQENKKLAAFEPGNSTKRMDYEYDLVSGKVNKVKYQEGKGDQFYYTYRYDADNRVVEAQTSLDGLTWNTEASYRYYLHGPLARTELGNNKVQGLDYAYTLQGWLKGINSQELNPDKDMAGDGKIGSDFVEVARDVVAFGLGYFNNDYKAASISTPAFGMAYNRSGEPATTSGAYLYNGNISHITTANSKIDNGAVKGYTYRYDQLNRLKQMRMHTIGAGATTWNNSSIIDAYKENITYDANGNIATYQRNGNVSNGVAFAMDNLTYRYNYDSEGKLANNKLRNIEDAVSSGLYTEDIDGQSMDHYGYDKIGNLVSEGTSPIKWSVYGKISEVHTNSGDVITYTYDASGNRIAKTVQTTAGNKQHTFYVRDGQGNTMGVYTRYQPLITTPQDNYRLMWAEQHLYGSSRLGMWRPAVEMDGSTPPVPGGNGQFVIGTRAYEITNHLGNVLATISDSRTGMDDNSDGVVDYYTASVLTASDYYPFGMQMPGRIFNNGNYRYGFNGKENDNEVKGDGNQQDYGMRIYDPRVGRFLSFDPLAKEYNDLSPYHYAGNNPIQNLDKDGGEPLDYQEKWKPRSFRINGSKPVFSRNINDPQLGYINVEAVYDNWTKQTWFIHQGNDGRNYYWKHNPGADQTVRMTGNGKWEEFKTQNRIQLEQTAELTRGIAAFYSAAIAAPFVYAGITQAGGVAVNTFQAPVMNGIAQVMLRYWAHVTTIAKVGRDVSELLDESGAIGAENAAIKKMAFGFERNARRLASEIGAGHLMDFKGDWKSEFLKTINDKTQELHFSLDDFEGSVYSNILDFGRSNTNWELHTLFQNKEAFKRTVFHYGDKSYIGEDIFNLDIQ